jgi:hypothetical protein
MRERLASGVRLWRATRKRLRHKPFSIALGVMTTIRANEKEEEGNNEKFSPVTVRTETSDRNLSSQSYPHYTTLSNYCHKFV